MNNDTEMKPLVSVVIPVHNAGKYLRDALDSAVFQTLNNIEVIVVENGSTDDTYKIMQEYEEKYPDKIRIAQIPPANTSAEGRSFGFKLARADYIYSCDGDDLIDYRALENLYNLAVEGDYDIVGGRNVTYSGDKYIRSVSGQMKVNPTISDYIIHQNPAFWSRLIKKSLIEKMGDVPVDIPLSDVAYVLPMSSYAKKIGFINNPPIYHYFRRVGSEVNTPISQKRLDIISPVEIALQNCNPEYRDEMFYHCALRMYRDYTNRWMLSDMIIEWAKKYREEFEQNAFLKSHPQAYSLMKILSCSELMEPIVYLGGFVNKSYLYDDTVPVLWGDSEYVYLDENNCDINENEYIRQLYKDGNYLEVERYFAAKKIYESGGFYISNNIKMDIPLNSLRNRHAIFGYINKDTFSGNIFGGFPGDQLFREILETYSDGSIYNEKKYNFAERVKNILWISYRIEPDGLTKMDKTVTLLGPEVISCNPYEMKESIIVPFHFCIHTNWDKVIDDDMVSMPTTTLYAIMNNITFSMKSKTSGTRSLITAEYELEELKNSNVYKVAMLLKKIGNGPYGPFLKKIFHFCLKIRAKLKRK